MRYVVCAAALGCDSNVSRERSLGLCVCVCVCTRGREGGVLVRRVKGLRYSFRMALAAARKRQSVPRISEDECEGMEAKLQNLRQTLALEKAARSKLAAMQYVADFTHV